MRKLLHASLQHIIATAELMVFCGVTCLVLLSGGEDICAGNAA